MLMFATSDAIYTDIGVFYVTSAFLYVLWSNSDTYFKGAWGVFKIILIDLARG